MTRVFLQEAAADTSTPEFKNWFRNSKVVNDDGSPAKVYHGTSVAQDFEVFRHFNDVGYHFGTAQAASNRAQFRQKDPRYAHEVGRVYPVYLSIQNPLETIDWGTWEPNSLAGWLRDNGKIGERDYVKVASRNTRQDRSEELRKLLKRLGYDGIVYQNTAEDVGSKSWITLDPGQVKSIFNRGTWDKRRASISE